MKIEIDMPHAFGPDSSNTANARALKVMLDCMVALNQAYLHDHPCPALYRAGVIYGRTVVWDTIPAVIAKGYGDCKSLTPWLIAEYRQRGIAAEPVFRWVNNAKGGIDYHILVGLADGSFTDPSKVLGMGKNENAPMTAGNDPRFFRW